MYVSYKTHTYTYLVYDQVYTAVPAVVYKVPMACTRQACTAHQLNLYDIYPSAKYCTTCKTKKLLIGIAFYM